MLRQFLTFKVVPKFSTSDKNVTFISEKKKDHPDKIGTLQKGKSSLHLVLSKKFYLRNVSTLLGEKF